MPRFAPWIIAALALAAALYSWQRPAPAPQKEYVTVEVPKEIRVISKQTVTVTQVQVIDKERLVKVREFPAWVRDDAALQVTAVGVVEPYKGRTEIASTLNTKTGESVLVSKRLPLPFLEFMNEKELGFRYGTETDVFGRWTFLRVGSFHLAGYGQAGKSAMAQLELSYRW